MRSRDISEETIVAMYMNNKGVEALVDGRVDDAYAWVREAIVQSPEYLGSHNTLGVIYMRRGDLAQARQRFLSIFWSVSRRMHARCRTWRR